MSDKNSSELKSTNTLSPSVNRINIINPNNNAIEIKDSEVFDNEHAWEKESVSSTDQKVSSKKSSN